MNEIFDSAGLPNDDAWLRFISEHLLTEIGAHGWDQPAQFFEILTPTGTELAAYAAGFTTADIEGTMYLTRPLDLPDVHPTLALVGWTPAPDVAAVVAVVEAWNSTNPGSYTRPSLDPERIEARMATVVTRSGRIYSVNQPRGGEAVIDITNMSDVNLSGVMVDVLKHAMGLPIAHAAVRPSMLLAGATARNVITILSEGREAFPHPPTEADVAMITHTVMRAVTWQASGHGKYLPQGHTYGRWFRDVCTLQVMYADLDDAQCAAYDAAVDYLGAITWEQLMGNKHSREFIPEQVRDVLARRGALQWCSAEILTDLVERFLPYTATDVRETLTDAAPGFAEVIIEELAPWWDDTPRHPQDPMNTINPS